MLALYKNTTGNNNSAMGMLALYNNTTGSNNTAIGTRAFYNGSNYYNSTAIGYNADVTDSNQVRIGNSSVSSIRGYVSWTNVSDGRFKTNVNENVIGLDFINELRPVTYNLDMDAIAKFQNTPDSIRLFEAEVQKEKMLQTGFIAQEVERAAQKLGYEFSGVDAPKNENDHYGLRYAEFTVPLVKAVQELSQQNEALKAENKKMQVELSAIKEMLKHL